jgi:hypothetical protein
MGANKPAGQKQTLCVVAQEKYMLEDDGDILAPLKKIRNQYVKRANELDEKMPGLGASDVADIAKRAAMLKVAAWYRKAADAVQFTIGVMRCEDFVEAPAPIDQTEIILSDVERCC